MSWETAQLIHRIAVCAPMLFAGLFLLIAPAACAQIVVDLLRALRSFQDSFRTPLLLRTLQPEPAVAPVTPLNVFRIVGFLLAFAALLAMTEL